MYEAADSITLAGTWMFVLYAGNLIKLLKNYSDKDRIMNKIRFQSKSIAFIVKIFFLQKIQ
jgi:hypothetical protein